MKKLAAFVLMTGFVAGATQFAGAADTAAGPPATTPKCAAKDPVVMVNSKTKMYTMADPNTGKASAGAGQAETTAMNTNKGSMASDSTAGKDSSAATTATTTTATASAADYTQMCKSKAEAMGAKMMPKSGSLLNSKVGTGGSH